MAVRNKTIRNAIHKKKSADAKNGIKAIASIAIPASNALSEPVISKVVGQKANNNGGAGKMMVTSKPRTSTASSGGKILKTATPRTSAKISGAKVAAKRVRHPGSATTSRTTPSRSATKKQYY